MTITTPLWMVADGGWTKVKAASTFSDSTSLHKHTCPAGKKTLIFQMGTYRSDAATLDVTLKDSADDILYYLCDEAAGTGYFNIPTSAGATASMRTSCAWPIILEPGDYIEFAFGAAQGATAIIAICEVQYDV